MIRRTFFRTIALAAAGFAGFAGWLKAAPAATKGWTITDWTITHRIDKDGLHVMRSIRTVTRIEYIARPGLALCDVPPLMSGFVRSIDVQEDIYRRHWDIGITDREIPRGT